jgi:hypothetical protein
LNKRQEVLRGIIAMPESSNDEKRLVALAAFVPVFEDPAFSAGKMVFPPNLPNGVARVPYSSRSEPVSRFVSMLYDKNWIISFDWSDWLRMPAAQALFEKDGVALSEASADQLSRMLTICERRCKFSWGDPLLEDFESGLILRIVRRAAALVKEGQS